MSMSVDYMSSLTDVMRNNASANTSELKSSLSGISSESTDEELLQVCKDFESYFVEEILKEVKENMVPKEEDEDSSLSTLRDFHMDSVMEMVADEMVDEVATGFTQQLFEQMKRNYNIS